MTRNCESSRRRASICRCPRVEALTAENLVAYPELRQYVADQRGDDFHLVRLGCSFKLNPEEPFTTAVVEVNLQPGTGRVPPQSRGPWCLCGRRRCERSPRSSPSARS